jgi:predicted amidohydrolase YtcJ
MLPSDRAAEQIKLNRFLAREARWGVKWWLDSSPFERSCAFRRPYADDLSTLGVNFSPDEIRPIITEAGRRNIQVVLHIAGD